MQWYFYVLGGVFRNDKESRKNKYNRNVCVYKTAYIILNWQVCLWVREEERVYLCQLSDEYS